MINFDLWFNVFKEGFKVRTIENEHLLMPSFLTFLSTINRVRYVYGGQYKVVNLSSFKVQQSGTGKGVADRFVGDCLRFLKFNTCKINSFTEAAIIGSLYIDNFGQSHIVKGALGDYDFIWIDEAKQLIEGNPWTNGLLSTVNGYLDDGMIFKRLAKGEIKYWSSCNFGTGTYFFNKLKPAILQTGLFQRCLFTYKHYTTDDVMRISKKYDELASKSYVDDLLPVLNELSRLKGELDFEKYNIGREKSNYVIRINEETSIKFGRMVDEFFEEEIISKLGDGRLKDIVGSFLIRSKELGHKVMVLWSVWNGCDVVGDESIELGFEIVSNQLRYITKFVSDVFEDVRFDSDDLEKFETKQKKIERCKREIIKTIKENPGMTKVEFREYLQKNRGLFCLGELMVIQKILPTLIGDGKIREEKPMKNRREMFVSE